MRTFNFTFLALFGCIAMIGATPLRAKAVGRRDVLPDCIELPDADVCVACVKDPDLDVCVSLCVVNPDVSFCVDICTADPSHSFCPSDDSSSD